MSAMVCLWLFLGLVFSHVSCSQNYEEGPARSSQKAFSSYRPIQSQGAYGRSVASSFGPSYHWHGPVSSYQTASISKNVNAGVGKSSLPASGATEYSVNQNGPSFQPRKSYGGKSWSSMAKPSVVSSGGIIIVPEGGGSQGSLKPKMPNQDPVNSNGSKTSKVSQIGWRSANLQLGSTSSTSFQSGALDYSARETSGDQSPGYRDQKPAPVYPIQKPNQAPQEHFGIPESPMCNFDIPEIYGRGSIRRCSRYRKEEPSSQTESDASLHLAPSQFNQNFSPSKSLVTTGFTSAVHTSDGGVGRTASAPNGPDLQAWSGSQLFHGDTNQDIVPIKHRNVQSSRTARLFPPEGDKAPGSGGYMVSENAPYHAKILQNRYSTQLHEHEAHPSSSAPSAWNGFWNVPPKNEGISGFNGYSQRFLSSKVSADSRQAPAAIALTVTILEQLLTNKDQPETNFNCPPPTLKPL
ncbi:hypothetical protein AOLI_G00322410 [Acnodon oligacanthus]